MSPVNPLRVEAISPLRTLWKPSREKLAGWEQVSFPGEQVFWVGEVTGPQTQAGQSEPRTLQAGYLCCPGPIGLQEGGGKGREDVEGVMGWWGA